ncbi:MAG: HAD-IIIC family phosphatase [Parvularculaceae bacterium]
MTAETASEPLVISSSFAFDPALEAIGFLARKVDLGIDLRLAPYAQVIPQLLAPASELRACKSGRVVAVRLNDLAGPERSLADAAAEFARAVHAADDGAPTLVLLCPGPAGADGAAVEALWKAFAGHASIKAIDAREAFAEYGVREPFDPRADAAAHIPYTEEAFAALAAAIVRWRALKGRAPVKLIAVDGDNTLWDGVLGEDGPEGLGLGPARRALQQRLVEAAEGGQIVALLSKNEDADVSALFAARADFPLRLEHILARRVNWRPKTENLRDLAEEFAVAPESILFVDDNPVECAAMRASLPQVLTVRAPESGDDAFLKRLWLFDRPDLTVADLKRIDSYRAEEERKAAKADAPTLREFFETLGLRIEIAAAKDADVARIAQMTRRTNQFNATMKRLDERDVALRRGRLGEAVHVVSVSDRFGDYGVVGCMAAAPAGDALNVDLFMLSCRALGRGVEHAMVGELARLAEGRGLKRLTFEYVEGPRNGPARRFLSELTKVELFGDGVAGASTAAARAFVFNPDQAGAGAGDAETSTAEPVKAAGEKGVDKGAGYEWIAAECATGAAIVAAMKGAARARPDLSVGFVLPAPGLESHLATIWEEALGVGPVGAHDPFRELGGRSIDAVRIHGLIARRLGIEADIVDLFRFGTVAQLAKHLADAAVDRVSLAETRGAQMRAARGAQALARGAFRERAS